MTNAITAKTLVCEVPAFQANLIRSIRYYVQKNRPDLVKSGLSMLLHDIVGLGHIGRYQSQINVCQIDFDCTKLQQCALLETLLCTVECSIRAAVKAPVDKLDDELRVADRAIAGAANALLNGTARNINPKTRPVRRDAEILTLGQKLLDEVSSGTTTNPMIAAIVRDLATTLRRDASEFGIESTIPAYICCGRLDITLADHYFAVRQLATAVISLTERLIDPYQTERFGIDDRDRQIADRFRRIIQLAAKTSA